jgi:hypothetical protein
MIDLTRHGFEVVARAPSAETHAVLRGDVRMLVVIMTAMGPWDHMWPKHFVEIGFKIALISFSDKLFRFMQEVGESTVAEVQIGSRANAWLYVSHHSIKKLSSKTISKHESTDFFAGILKSDSRVLDALRDYASTNPTPLLEFAKKPADTEVYS